MNAGEHVLAFAAWKSILRDPAVRAAARRANDGRRIRERAGSTGCPLSTYSVEKLDVDLKLRPV
jgi:hypothetical protein